MTFLDEGNLKKSFINWCKNNRSVLDHTVLADKNPCKASVFCDLFFECEFFKHSWFLVETRHPGFWRQVNQLLELLTTACGVNMLSVWKDECDDNIPLALNYFAFSNEVILETLEKMPAKASKTSLPQTEDAGVGKPARTPTAVFKQIHASILNVYGFEPAGPTPSLKKVASKFVINVIKNSASPLTLPRRNIDSLLGTFFDKATDEDGSIGILTPVKLGLEGRPTTMTGGGGGAVKLDRACSQIPAPIFSRHSNSSSPLATKASIEKAYGTIFSESPAAFTSVPTNIHIEIVSRAIALDAVNRCADEFEPRTFIHGRKYYPTSGFALKKGWPDYGDHFGCIAKYTSVENIRRIHNILEDKLEEIETSEKGISPWNDNTLFKVVIASVWYAIIFYKNMTIQKSYGIIFDHIKKWKIVNH